MTLLISSGAKLVEVPSVVGLQQDLAESALRDAGLIPDIEQRDSDEPEGEVIAQDPAGGSTVKKHTTVTVVVSTGAGSAIVPNVVGQSKDEARADLKDAGLSVRIVKRTTSDPNEDGQVLEQSPAAGTRLRRGEFVTVFVGKFSEPPTTTTPTTTSARPLMRVAVLSGGRSSEHQISLNSGASVAEGLRAAGHEVIPVLLERDGRWTRDGEEIELRAGGGLLDAEVAFPVLHGPFGEDGTVQGLLECLDLPYVGPGVLAAAVAIDKLIFKRVLAFHDIPQVDVLRGGRGRLARAGGGHGPAAVGEARAVGLERRDLEGDQPRARAGRGGRAGPPPRPAGDRRGARRRQGGGVLGDRQRGAPDLAAGRDRRPRRLVRLRGQVLRGRHGPDRPGPDRGGRDGPRARARRPGLPGGRRLRPRPLRLLRPRGRRGPGQRDQHDPRASPPPACSRSCSRRTACPIRSSATAWSGWASSGTRSSAASSSEPAGSASFRLHVVDLRRCSRLCCRRRRAW